MKKANHAILTVFVLFICILLGIFIGRVSARNQISASTLSTISRQSTLAPKENTGNGLIDINTASSRQLQMLPNIGEVLAGRIIAYRTQYGPFSSIEDLLFVEGIGEKRLDVLREYITVGG